MPLFEAVEFHGMPAIRWQHRDGARAIATLQGAQIVSWVPVGGEECLYVSPRSPFEAGRPIRGGIPICFPQFADSGPLAQHGFARTLPWVFTSASESEDGARVSLVLEDSAQTRALWPGRFRLELVATLGPARLDVQLGVTNTGTAAWAFTAALHTYFAVPEAAMARLEGLRGVRYVNRGEGDPRLETREAIAFAEPIDRVYFAAPTATRLDDGKRSARIVQRGFADTVVWNPGLERTALMRDMPPDGFRSMACVEAATVDPPVSMEPGATWQGGQSINVRIMDR